MKVAGTEDRTTYTGDDAIVAFKELKEKYGKQDASNNSSDEEPDSKDNEKSSGKEYKNLFAKIVNQLEISTQSAFDNAVSQQEQQGEGGGPPYY